MFLCMPRVSNLDRNCRTFDPVIFYLFKYEKCTENTPVLFFGFSKVIVE